MGIANVDAAAQHWSSEGSDAVSVVKTPPPRRVRGHIPYLRRKEVPTRNVFSVVGLVNQDPLLSDVGPLSELEIGGIPSTGSKGGRYTLHEHAN